MKKALRSGIDISDLHHNHYKGFFALRPGLMATGSGDVRFNQFKYLPLQPSD